MKSDELFVQDYCTESFAWCYGCGRLNAAGHHFRTRWDGDTTLTEYLPKPDHIAIPGFVYGGLIAALIDCHSTGSASLALYRRDGHELGDQVPPPRCMTASLTVDYRKPTPLGTLLQVRGTIREMGTRKVVVESELLANGEITASSRVVAVVAKTLSP